MSVLRDTTVHKYQTMRKEDICNTGTDDLPVFEKQLAELLQNIE